MRETGVGKGFRKGLSEEGIFQMENGNVLGMQEARETARASTEGLGREEGGLFEEQEKAKKQ